MTSSRLKFTSRLAVLTILGTPITTATQNASYAGFTVSATGGVAPYAYSVASGTLPVGMSLNAVTGLVSGTPTVVGVSSNIVIRVTDFLGTQKNLAAFSLTVSAGSNIVITDATGGGPYAKFPVFRNAEVTRTPQVAQDDEAIDVQAVCGVPYSPLATTITIGGDIQYFDAITGGKLVFKPAQRASIPKDGKLLLTVQAQNAAGLSDLAILYVFVPLDADCRFIDPAAANDSGTGLWGSPWKNTPRTSAWTGTGGADNGPQYTGATAKCFFYKVGRHERSLTSSGYFPPDHTGSSTKQHRYVMNGWGGQAKLCGDDALAGSWSSVTSGEVYANPSFASVEKVAAPVALENYQSLFCGTVMCFLSQYPRPTDLTQTEGAQEAADNTNSFNGVTSVGGMKRVFFTNNSSDTTTVRMYRGGVDGTHPTGQGVTTITDPALGARFNNVDVAFDALGIGVWVQLWAVGNNIVVWPVQQFTAATNTISFNTGTSGLTTSGNSPNMGAYALLGSPYDVQVAGQYALSPARTTIYAYRPNTNLSSVAIREIAGHVAGTSYVSYEYGWSERFAGGTKRATGASVKGGIAFLSSASGATPTPGVQIRGWRVHQMRSDNEDASGIAIVGGSGTYGFDNPTFERFHFTEGVHAAGFVFNGTVNGRLTGSGAGGKPTFAEVVAWPTGKLRWNYFDTNSIGRTAFYMLRVSGLDFYENVLRNLTSIHGNGWSLYTDTAAPTSFTDHCAIRLNFEDNVQRGVTTSIVDPTIVRSNWYDSNVMLGQGTNQSTMALYSGEPGSVITRNILLRSTTAGDTYPSVGLGKGYGVNFNHNILNGMTWSTGTDGLGILASWTIDSNGLTGGSLPTNSGGQVTSNTTTLATAHSWDGTTIPSPWQTILGSGQIGPFWRIP